MCFQLLFLMIKSNKDMLLNRNCNQKSSLLYKQLGHRWPKVGPGELLKQVKDKLRRKHGKELHHFY